MRLHNKVTFIPYGSILEPQAGIIAVDVGNHLCRGILDHHHPGAEKTCAAGLVLKHPEFVVDHVQGRNKEDVTIITHLSPDLDAVTAVYFCSFLLNGQPLPDHADKIADYVCDVDRGFCGFLPDHILTPYNVFTALCHITHQKGIENGLSAEDIYRQQLTIGFDIWNYLLPLITEETDLHIAELFRRTHPFQQAESILKNDFQIYLEDVKKGDVRALVLPNKSGENRTMVDGLFIKNPASLLFKSWARGDLKNSPLGKGFTLLAVNHQNSRYIISVDPASPYYLKGLGDLIEARETQKRKETRQERKGEPRPGYMNPDPWYDGRNSLHNYTIIDTPRAGTVLTWDEIRSIIEQYGH